MPILHKSKYILLNNEIIENRALLIDNGRIKKILNSDEIEIYQNAARIIEHGQALITPGFINLHTHLQYTDLKPFIKHSVTNQEVFVGWVTDLLKQYSFWDKNKKIESFKNGLKETVMSGVTCVANLSTEEEFLEILNNAQVKSFIFLETFSNCEEMSNKEFKKLTAKFKRMNENKSDNVRLGFSPHSIYNVHACLWKKIAKFSADNDILVHTHLGESVDEIKWLNGLPSEIDKLHSFVGWNGVNNLKPIKIGLNPVEYLEYLDILNILKENLTVAHLNQLDINSIETLINTKIAHCPRSNMFLHNKTFKADELSDTALKNTGLGTDSKASNYDLNILKEAKFLQQQTSLDFFEIINMLTINPARILKIDNITGSLEKGKDADFLVFKLGENQDCQSIFDRQGPDEIYIKGNILLLSK